MKKLFRTTSIKNNLMMIIMLTSAAVTLTNIRAQGNSSDGIEIYSKGNVLLTSISSNSNSNTGMYVNNSFGTLGNVTLTGTTNGFQYNEYGLVIETNGLVALSNAVVSDNRGEGVVVLAYGFGKAVTLTNITSARNAYEGIFIDAQGPINMTNCVIKSNGFGYSGSDHYSGVWINGSASYNITFTGCAVSGNAGNGIYARDYLNVVLNTTTYYGNVVRHATGDKNLNIW